MKIRRATLQDIPEILDIINYEIKNSTSVYDEKERSLEEQTNWFLLKEQNSFPVLVAEQNQTILGFGSYGIFRPWDGYKFSVEHSIYIHKSARGLGTGKLLMTSLIQEAKKNNFHTMVAGIDAENTKSITFHKQFGFNEIGTFKQIGYKFNKWLDLVFLQLFLKNS